MGWDSVYSCVSLVNRVWWFVWSGSCILACWVPLLQGMAGSCSCVGWWALASEDLLSRRFSASEGHILMAMELFTKNLFYLFIGWRCTQNSFLLKRGARPSYCFRYCCAFVICAWFFQGLFFDCTWFPPGVCVHQLFWTIGGMFEVLLALWIMPTLGWRWLLGLSATPTAVCIICSYVSVLVIYKINWWDQSFNWNRCVVQWLPESPRFDIMMGNTVKAVATLKTIAKENGKSMPEGRIIAQKLVSRTRRIPKAVNDWQQ